MQSGFFSYSLDKIKFKGKINAKKMWFGNKAHIRYWCSYGLPDFIELVNENETLLPFKYRFSYTLRVKGEKEGSFFICEHYNGDFRNQRQEPHAFLIEYNPNKSGSKIFEEFKNYFVFKITEIVSIDIAYDLPNVSVHDIFVDTKCDVMTYGKTLNFTTYISPKEDSSGRVKIYQKDIEREVKGVDLSRTLRIECSLKGKFLTYDTFYGDDKTFTELEKCVGRINSVKIKQLDNTVQDWKLYALSRLTPFEFKICLSKMASATRTKFKKQLLENCYYDLGLDIFILTKQISELLEEYKRWVKLK